MKLGMKSTFIMAEMKSVCKMGSFIQVYKCISAKIAGKIKLVHESETSFNPQIELFNTQRVQFLFAVIFVIFQSSTQSPM